MRASISVAIAGLLWFSTYVSAQPNKELYELQELCGKRAAEVFEREYSPRIANTKDVQWRYNYENHYNARLNKCFFLVTYELWRPKSEKSMRLIDLNENKEYGNYSATDTHLICVVRGKGCSDLDNPLDRRRSDPKAESEWRQLVKPFMED